MASFGQNWKISLPGSIYGFGVLKLLRFHFGNLLSIIGEVVWLLHENQIETLKTEVYL